MYFVYLLESTAFNRFYIGVTSDLVNRIKKHNNGSSFSTKPYKPWIVIYSEKYLIKENAYKRMVFKAS